MFIKLEEPLFSPNLSVRLKIKDRNFLSAQFPDILRKESSLKCESWKNKFR